MENHNGLPWPGINEKLVVAEMIQDTNSEHWDKCRMFVERCTHAKAKNISRDLQEEIIQDVMYKLVKYLPNFRFQCTLKTWLNLIVERCSIDYYRRLQNEVRFCSLPDVVDPPFESDDEDEEHSLGSVSSAEDIFLINNDLRMAQSALLEYANTHSNPIRDRLIIRMVIFEGCTQEHAAKAAGCNTPVVGYIVREAQRYVREKIRFAFDPSKAAGL